MPTPSVADAPSLDEFGILRHRGRWVALSHAEESAMRLLLHDLGQVVPRQAFNQRLWPGRDARRSIDTLICRLRRSVAPIGLRIATVRSRGFLLEAG